MLEKPAVSEVLQVFTYNIIPIFLVAALGFWMRRSLRVDKKGLSAIIFNGLSPCLVYASLVNSQLTGDELLRLALFAFLFIILMALLAWTVGWLLGWSRSHIAALVLVVTFVNAGNYGLVLNQLRYGEEGLARAIIYFVVSTLLIFTVGILVAAMGKLSWRDALKNIIRLPPIYGVVLAMLVYGLQLETPEPLMRAVEIAGDGAIPAMLVLLGMQIADMRGVDGLRESLLASILRLVIGPIVALLLANMLALQGLSRSASIIEASTPTAIMTIILATEFDAQPEMVTNTVLVSTILSIVTLPVVITLFGL